MKLHIHESIKPPVSAALEQVQRTLTDADIVSMEESEGGVVILNGDPVLLESIHDFRRVYVPVIMSRDGMPGFYETPHNVRPMGIIDLSTRSTPVPPVVTGMLQLGQNLPEIELQRDSEATQASDAVSVLVIDDTLKHVQAAIDQLGDQRLTIATTFKQGMDRIDQLHPDIVLTDLQLPASAQTLSPDARREYAGRQQPMGHELAWYALQQGVKTVGVLTDGNHHGDLHSAAFDKLGRIDIGDARIVLSNSLIRGGVKDWRALMEKLLEA